MTGTDTRAQPGSGQLLADVTAALDAVRNKDWVTAGIDGISGVLDLLGGTGSPLSALTDAGFGFIIPFIDFLDEPRQQLTGNPGSITASAQGIGGGGDSVTALADSYRQSIQAQTTGWKGAASAGYQDNGAQRADGIAALGKSSTAISSAISGAGQVVAQVAEAVLELATDAVGLISAILAMAAGSSGTDFGGSMAAAVPPSVGVATDASAEMAAKMSALMSSAQKLMSLIQAIMKVVTDAEKLLRTLAPTGGDTTAPQSSLPAPADGATGDAGTGPAATGPTAPVTTPADSTAPDATPAPMPTSPSPSPDSVPAATDLPTAPNSPGLSASPVAPADGAAPVSAAPSTEVNVVIVEEVRITPGN